MSQHVNSSPGNPERSANAGPDAHDQPAITGQGTRPGRATRSMGVTDLAADHPDSGFDRILRWVPRILASKPHIVWLMALGVYLIVLPLVGIAVSAKAELIGGNYTNVTSDIGACIAAGGTLHLVKQSRRREQREEERLTLLKEMHALLHHLHPDAAAQLGHAAGPPREGGPPPAAPGMPAQPPREE